MAHFDGTDDYFDSREVIERIAELKATEVIEREPEEQEELDALYALQEEAEGVVADFPYGETFISDDHFEEYTKEMLTDAGYISEDMPSWIILDWSETARNVQQDYTSFEFRGATYWAR